MLIFYNAARLAHVKAKTQTSTDTRLTLWCYLVFLWGTIEVDILISTPLADALHVDTAFQTIPMGETALRGRQESMELFAVKESASYQV